MVKKIHSEDKNHLRLLVVACDLVLLSFGEEAAPLRTKTAQIASSFRNILNCNQRSDHEVPVSWQRM